MIVGNAADTYTTALVVSNKDPLLKSFDNRCRHDIEPETDVETENVCHRKELSRVLSPQNFLLTFL